MKESSKTAIIIAYEQGYGPVAIAKKLGVSRQHVHNTIRHHKSEVLAPSADKNSMKNFIERNIAQRIETQQQALTLMKKIMEELKDRESCIEDLAILSAVVKATDIIR